MTGLDSIATQLFEKIRSRFPKIVMGDENGAPTSDEGTARFYDFDWVVNGENQGAVSISISEAESLKVYYSQNMLENLPEPIENEWYNFLKEMRFFAKKHMMGFDTRDIAKSNLDKRDYQYLANKQVQESTMYGTTKSSYEELDKTKLIIRHKKEITPEQSGARTRHISSLFIENESGERFKYPFAHLAGARAMARHVANSGVPHDDFGKHIIATSENIAKLTAFKRFVGKKDFMNTTSNDIIEGSNVELDYMRSHLKKLQGQGYYAQSKENFIPVESTGEELGEDIVNDLTNAFTIPQFNEELKDMFPLLHSIHQKRVAETTVSLDDVLDESNDDIIFKGKQIDTDTIEYDMQDPSDLLFVLDSGMKYTDGTEVDDDDLEELDQLPAMIDWIAVDYNDRLHDQADMQRDMERERFETSNTPEDEFEEWADSVIDEALDKQRIDMLNKMISKSLPVGPDATNAINSLKGIIEDEGLMNELKSLAESDPESCARPAIYRYLKQNDPEALDDLDFGDMTMEDDDDTTDVTIDKDGAMKLAGDDEEPKDEKASTEDIIEFVRSFYDTETGAFPKGETGVVISARKRFGDSVGDLVEKFVSKLTGNEVQVEDDQDVEKDNKGYTDKEIKMAFGVLNDKRFKGGNYTGAVEVIEKIAKGLSQHPSVVKALQRTNEDLAYIKDKLAKLIR